MPYVSVPPKATQDQMKGRATVVPVATKPDKTPVPVVQPPPPPAVKVLDVPPPAQAPTQPARLHEDPAPQSPASSTTPAPEHAIVSEQKAENKPPVSTADPQIPDNIRIAVPAPDTANIPAPDDAPVAAKTIPGQELRKTALGIPRIATKSGTDAAIRPRHTVDPALQSGGSLPVLEAFQGFLDQERERTRKRITVLAYVLVGVFVLFLLLGILIGAIYTSGLREELAGLKVSLAEYSEQADKSRTTMDNLTDAAAKLKSELDSEKAKSATRADDVSKVKQNIDDLRNLKEGWAALYTSVGAMQKEMSALRLRLLGSESVGMSRPMQNIPTTIVPAGQTNRVNWLMPIPEVE